jgi:hypothetical protein
MTDFLTTITKLIQSPPGQLAAGGVPAGMVWKFFERVEAVLTDQTKLEIAVWLLGRKKFGPKVQPWPDTFTKLFDRVYGTKHLSWKCFGRSALTSVLFSSVIICVPAYGQILLTFGNLARVLLYSIGLSVVGNIVPDYVSLLETRQMLRFAQHHHRSVPIYIALDLVVTTGVAVLTACFVEALRIVIFVVPSRPEFGNAIPPVSSIDWLMYFWGRCLSLAFEEPASIFVGVDGFFTRAWFYPAFFTSIWLWLYAGSGFLLKAARRFDIGFDWFNRKFDIEKKPLQSIGLVAGALVAVVYWVAAIVSRMVG